MFPGWIGARKPMAFLQKKKMYIKKTKSDTGKTLEVLISLIFGVSVYRESIIDHVTNR